MIATLAEIAEMVKRIDRQREEAMRELPPEVTEPIRKLLDARVPRESIRLLCHPSGAEAAAGLADLLGIRLWVSQWAPADALYAIDARKQWMESYLPDAPWRSSRSRGKE